MAERGENYSKNFRSKAILNRAYARYRKTYFAMAKKNYKKLTGIPAKQKVRVSQETLKDYMYDPTVLSKRQFAKEYKAKREQLAELESTSDPIHYIVRDQAYKFSEAQYRTFSKLTKETEEFKEFRGITREEFRMGGLRSEQYKDLLSRTYQDLKEKYRQMGKAESELADLAHREMQDLYFNGSP